eukprot:11880558-Ditylum_brightwellii.AAC.1
MSVEGITCAHCVKIIETIQHGCNGKKSPSNTLPNAAAECEELGYDMNNADHSSLTSAFEVVGATDPRD